MANWRLLRSRLRKIAVGALLLVVFGLPFVMTMGDVFPQRAATGLLLVGIGLGVFEEFYVQANAGEWLRRLNPLLSLAVAVAASLMIAAGAAAINLVLWGSTLTEIGRVITMLASHLHIVLILSAALVLSLRAVSFVGGRTLFYLLTGRYHRPVRERRVLAFVDIKGSTEVVERVGPLRAREAIGRIVSQLSRLAIENGGDVYLFTGDGLIASWDWDAGLKEASVLAFARAALQAVRASEGDFSRDYGSSPGIRIGIHGGEVVVSQQGDVRRSIGIWGDAINIAARLEQAAKELGKDCIVSEDVVSEIKGGKLDLEPLPPIHVKGISHGIAAYAIGNPAQGS